MNGLADRNRLAQAQRISALKVRRHERARIAAARAASEAHARAAAAEERTVAADREHHTARALFFAEPQQADAGIWLIATSERAQHASREQAIAADHSINAGATADAARQTHERSCVREGYLVTRATALTRDIARRAQDRADEAMEEHRR